MTNNTSHGDRIEVHLYGRLSQRLSEHALRHKRVLTIEARPDETFSTLLARLGIRPEDLYTVFLNGGILVTRNGMAPWLRYQQAQEDVWNWDGDVALRPGDRLGLFGEDMALLVV
ncbi:MAG: hypothetical protein MUF84_09365 [Anaerolineae bacterium]|nr:hypothetical protein [Anaerolineae bacterium]